MQDFELRACLHALEDHTTTSFNPPFPNKMPRAMLSQFLSCGLDSMS